MNEADGVPADLYRGTADDYERFRPGYSADLLADLIARVAPSGRGAMLDLACGTGQLAFALSERFTEVWAVDQEPDMIRVVRAKARAAGNRRIRPVAAGAEDLDLAAGSLELVTVGNAFHRLSRAAVAGRVRQWLRPGRHLALCWSSSPWTGPADWQRAMSEALQRWRDRLDAEGRIPAGWSRARQERSDADVLAGAGLEVVGRYRFPVERHWSVAELIGLTYSTSFLPRSVVAGHAADFEADLTAELGRYHGEGGSLTETTDFAYDLARRPPASP